jgi:hypothetical protein
MKRKSLIIALFLLIIASLSKRSLQAFLFIYSVARAIYNKKLEGYIWELNESIDCNGNVIGKYFWDDTMIKEDSVDKFGNRKETMSSVYGKNELTKKYKKFGLFWINILNRVDKNHCIDSIDINI